jgi:acyl-CoA synthetase (AMP-forming)/AMP-acid ligase II
VKVRIVDPERGEVLPAGEEGEIEVLSPSRMAGYLPESETAAAFRDGWYRTGDIGWLEPEGWLHITDRLKEMIKVRGFQVAPAEIEAVLHGDTRVRDCAVFGVPDAELGEAIVAAVVLVEGESVTEEELQELVGSQLAGYKRVRHVELVDEVPRLPSGKALRRTLKEQWLAAH